MYYCAVKEGDLITFTYTNWQGVTSKRKAIVKEFLFGANDYHTEYQMMMIRAFDVDKLEERSFIVKDMKDVKVIEIHP